MVFKRHPLEMKLEFEDRAYDLGDTIDIQVNLSPNGDVDVREARVDLVCKQRYTRWSQPTVYVSSSRGMGPILSASAGAADARIESFVHSSASFLEGTRLRQRGSSKHRIRLTI